MQVSRGTLKYKLTKFAWVGLKWRRLKTVPVPLILTSLLLKPWVLYLLTFLWKLLDLLSNLNATFLSPTAQTTLLFYVITIGSLSVFHWHFVSGEVGAKDYLQMFYPVRMKLVEYHKKWLGIELLCISLTIIVSSTLDRFAIQNQFPSPLACGMGWEMQSNYK